MILLNPFFGTLLWFFFLSRHGWKHWLTRVTATVISLLIISYINFLTFFRLFSVPVTGKWQMPESTHCKEMPLSFKLLLLQLGFKCSAAADKLRFILLGSQCLRTLNQAFPFFFFGCFYFRMRGNLPIYRKMSISRLVWGDRRKLHGEMQRHAILITYMLMTNDRCEDSFV